MPSQKQWEDQSTDGPTVAEAEDRGLSPLPSEWDEVLKDPEARRIPIQQRRLSEIPRHVLRVVCSRCDRIVEIPTLDAVRLYGPHAIWKDVGQNLLENGCRQQTGQQYNGCAPSSASPHQSG